MDDFSKPEMDQKTDEVQVAVKKKLETPQEILDRRRRNIFNLMKAYHIPGKNSLY